MNRKLTRETWRVYFHLCRLFRKIQRAEHSDRATRIISKESKNQDRRLRKLEKEFDALRFQFTRDAEGLWPQMHVFNESFHQSGDDTRKKLLHTTHIYLSVNCFSVGMSRKFQIVQVTRKSASRPFDVVLKKGWVVGTSLMFLGACHRRHETFFVFIKI